MEIRNLADRNLDALEVQPEWHRYKNTRLEVETVELTPEQWDEVNRKSKVRDFDKKSRQHFDRTNNKKLNAEAYRIGIKNCRGLTRRIINEEFKLVWPWDDPMDEEITFSSREVMVETFIKLGRKSAYLNAFITDHIIPDVVSSVEEEEADEEEKKIS